MIKLEVRDYCQNCPEFEPEVKKMDRSMYYVDMIRGPGVETNFLTYITCKHEQKCGVLYTHMLQEKTAEEKRKANGSKKD